jgi:cytoskeleton protein RodZ
MSDFSMTEPRHDAAEQQPQQSAQLSPGAQLALRRQQFGWTVEQVASQINLAPRQIEAIESDNYAALPGMAVARGFIRAYAKLLRLDAAPLMAQLGAGPSAAENAMPPRRTIAATSFTPHRPATRARRSGGPGKWIAAVVLLALAGAGAYVAARHGELGSSLADKLSSHMPGSDKAAANLAEPARDAASAPVVDTRVAPPLTASGSAAPAPTGTASATDAAPAPAAAAVAPISPAVVAAAPAAAEPGASPSAANALVLKLREDSWVEIKRADNSTVVARVLRSGSTESFDIAGPVTLTVGNARGVDATLRGEPLSLKSGAKNNVARLRVK